MTCWEESGDVGEDREMGLAGLRYERLWQDGGRFDPCRKLGFCRGESGGAGFNSLQVCTQEFSYSC